MKQILWITMLISALAFGESTANDWRYHIRADGLACPYCAYGVEKKLMQIDGIKFVDVDLNKGLVIVIAASHVQLTEKQLTKLLSDAGFTFRSMKKEPMKEAAKP